MQNHHETDFEKWSEQIHLQQMQQINKIHRENAFFDKYCMPVFWFLLFLTVLMGIANAIVFIYKML